MRCPVDSRLWAQGWQRCSLGGKSYRWAEKLGWGRKREGGGPVWGAPAFIESKGRSKEPENEHPEGQRGDKEVAVFTKNKTRTSEGEAHRVHRISQDSTEVGTLLSTEARTLSSIL